MDTQAPQPTGETTERKYLLLLICLVAVTILSPLHEEFELNIPTLGPGYVVPTLLVVVMIAGVRAVSGHRLVRQLGTGLWIGTFLLHLLVLAVSAESTTELLAKSARDVLLLTGLTMLTWLILSDLFASGLGITRDRLRGAACAYLLMGMAWATAYALLQACVAKSFAKGGVAQTIEHDALVYYSFVTLTTLGYGDITPARPLAQTLAYLEAFVGQFFLTVLVAMLVGQRLAAWMAERKS